MGPAGAGALGGIFPWALSLMIPLGIFVVLGSIYVSRDSRGIAQLIGERNQRVLERSRERGNWLSRWALARENQVTRVRAVAAVHVLFGLVVLAVGVTAVANLLK
ncbi:MAG: hypothetical protein ACRDFX_08000 [Chloroflexota bacterium]